MMNMLLYDYGNRYMIMKSKNPEFESDTEEDGSIFEDDENVKLYDGEIKQSADEDVLGDLTANIDIEVSQERYQEFLKDLGKVEKKPSKDS